MTTQSFTEGQKKQSGSNRFTDEEVSSSYGYPAAYRVKSIAEQINILRRLLPGIGSADEKVAEHPLPDYAEGYFAIPRWETIAPTYCEALQKVLELIKQERHGKFHNFCEGHLGGLYIPDPKSTDAAFEKLGDGQKGNDILVVPAQFGLRHRRHSVRWTRNILGFYEFCLGGFAVSAMLLTHPERLVQKNDLWIDCPGDESTVLDDATDFDWAPCFCFGKGMVAFGMKWEEDEGEGFGSVTGFFPAVITAA